MLWPEFFDLYPALDRFRPEFSALSRAQGRTPDIYAVDEHYLSVHRNADHFLFVGTGVSIKEYAQTHKLDPTYHKRSLGIKFRVYPPPLLNILLMIIVFILVGAVDTYRVPAIVYQALFVVALLHFVKVKMIQHRCFRDNTRIILNMAGVK